MRIMHQFKIIIHNIVNVDNENPELPIEWFEKVEQLTKEENVNVIGVQQFIKKIDQLFIRSIEKIGNSKIIEEYNEWKQNKDCSDLSNILFKF